MGTELRRSGSITAPCLREQGGGGARHQVLAEEVNACALCTESEHFTHSRALSRSIISLSVVPGRKERQSLVLQITGRMDRQTDGRHWGLGKEAGVPSKSSSVEAQVFCCFGPAGDRTWDLGHTGRRSNTNSTTRPASLGPVLHLPLTAP